LPVIPIYRILIWDHILDPFPTHNHHTRFQRRLGAMNPETKLVLDALTKHFDDMEARWERSFFEAEENLEKEFAEAKEKWESRFAQSDDKWER
jgi:hypothetical protein